MPMTETPEVLIETPPLAGGAADRVELLSDVLAHVRLSGALYLRGRYSSPWALDSPPSEELVKLLAPGAQRLIPFHVVRRGRAWFEAGGVCVEASAGWLAVVPHADRHRMRGAGAVDAVPIERLLPPQPWTQMPMCVVDGGGENTEVVCGYLRCNELLFNSLLVHLPPVFAVRPEGAAAGLIHAAVDYVMEEPPIAGRREAPLLSRLPELLLVEALRLYGEAAPASIGWLAATGDPIVGRALRLLHDDPAHAWTVDALANRAATSRSVLDERFRALLGRSPIRYLTEWRMQIAADLLRSTSLTLAQVAERSGYSSDASFSRAFCRHVGVSPAQWRDMA